jgi:cysteine-rich repeat protein
LIISTRPGHQVAMSIRALMSVAVVATVAGCAPTGSDGDDASLVEAIASPAPDYVVSLVSDPPPAAVNGASFPISVKVTNAGDASATIASTTRFFLSLDRLVGSRAFAQAAVVPALAIAASDTQSVTLVIPSGVPSGSYFVLACADGRKNIAELHENNNCAASAGAVAVTGPDLVEVVSDPPDLEATFAITDTTRNRGTADASSSVVGYYLSLVPSRGPGSVRLVVRRETGPIAVGGASTSTVTASAPALPDGSYYLIACADLSDQVSESDETNNCTASAGTGVVGPADLVVSALGDPPASRAAGDAFSVADAVANLGHRTTPESVLQFFLSQDELPGGNDLPLERSRTRVIRELHGGGASSAIDELTIDPTTPPGDYFLLACADATGAVAESSESNNCRASTTRVTVTATTCGDLQITGAEQCDDGNLVDDDGCDRDCKPTGVVQLAGGAAHTCARMRSGGVRCWGSGLYGQLGNGSTVSIGDDETPASVPDVDVGGKVVQLAAGYYHTCAILAGGAVRCWGAGSYGNLGYGNTANIGDDETAASAGNVDVGAPAVGITAGPYDTCALLEGGTVRCWGNGKRGRLGYGNLGSIGDNETPASAGDVDVGGTVVQVVAAHRHTCALLDTGKVRCWGEDAVGQLGYGNARTIGDDETPASAGDVDVGGRVVQIDAAGDDTCALLDTGAVRCWGSARFGAVGYPGRGNIGDNETPASVGDVDVGGAVAEVDVGDSYTCVRLTTGAVRCWGEAIVGQLGYGNRIIIGDDETPASAGDVAIGGSTVGIGVGVTHTCALLATGAVRCWGEGTDGMLGYGNTNTIGDNEVPASVGPVDVY